MSQSIEENSRECNSQMMDFIIDLTERKFGADIESTPDAVIASFVEDFMATMTAAVKSSDFSEVEKVLLDLGYRMQRLESGDFKLVGVAS